ncbi:MAG: sulfatase-like hydrolase/transferase [Bacillota bacterium]|nr:sulfatase-like hydrolase/transferase [Bacillota bacterium]
MSKKLPHIIIFNPDQFRSDALGHLGCEAAVTPNLDGMCETDGVSFAKAFCQNPVCTPSRCSFMSGWYPHVHGHRTMYYMMQPNEPVLLKILKDNGYFVWWGGKNDLIPGQNGHADYCTVYNRTQRKITGHNLHTETAWRGEPEGDNFYSFYAGKVEPKEGDQYIDNDWAHVLDAIDLLKNYDGEQPLCIYLPLGHPHPPYGIEEPYYSMIDRSKVQPPIPPYADWRDKPSILHGIREGQHLKDWSEDRWIELKATYYGMCARVDTQFGMLMDTLKATGRYDDSAVFFFSDHGDFTGDYGLVEKTQNTFQDCLTNVPFIIKPPKSVNVKSGIADALVELVDFPSTVSDLTGIELDYTTFGRSLVPVLEGIVAENKDAVFCEGGRMQHEWHCSEHQSASALPSGAHGLYSPRIRLQMKDGPEHSKAIMLRTHKYKYVYRVYEKDELYDLVDDPGESVNRIDDEKLQPVLSTLKERMLKYLVETTDVVPYQGDMRSF